MRTSTLRCFTYVITFLSVFQPVNTGNCNYRSLLADSSGELTDGADTYGNHLSCMFLISLHNTSQRIQLTFNELSLECGWDYINVFDGNSLNFPKLMTISGDQLDFGGQEDLSKLEVISSSSSLIVLFTSDIAAVSDGFNITYSTLPGSSIGESATNTGVCYSDCNQTCILNGNTFISECGTPAMPNGDAHTFFALPSLSPPLPRAGHTSVLYEGCIYVYGGYTFVTEFSAYQYHHSVFKRCLPANEWETITPGPLTGPHPAPRYGHTSIVYKDCMYVYGGTFISYNKPGVNNEITNELWRLNITSMVWTPLSSSNQTLSTTGHVSELVPGGRMIVLLGHSRDQFALSSTREYLIEEDTWIYPLVSSPNTYQFVDSASAYSPLYKLIFVYGGYNVKASSMDPHLYAYHSDSHSWTSLPTNSLSRAVYQHAMVLINDSYLLVNGGLEANLGKCGYSSTFVYDLKCGTWHMLETNSQALFEARQGHTLTALGPDSAVLFGGYNQAILFNDLLQINLYNLPSLLNTSACVDKISCQQHSCVECVTVSDCEWYDTSCQLSSDAPTLNASQESTNLSICQTGLAACVSADCWECQIQENCTWENRQCREKEQNETADACSPGCGSMSCQECGRNCLYCPSQQQCVSTHYPVEFPYGQCLIWSSDKGNCSVDSRYPCSSHLTCDECQTDYYCGWCATHISGLGVCMQGSLSSPANLTCPVSDWYYFTCPLCQCNGHSFCNNSSSCLQCMNHTQGDHCSTCVPWYYGDPRNGNTCTECECSVYGVVCLQGGTCECSAYGVIGNHCEFCEYNGTVNTSCYKYQEPQTIMEYSSPDKYSRSMLFMTQVAGQEEVSIKFTIYPHNTNAYTLINIYKAVDSNSKILNSLSPLLDELSESVREELIAKLASNTSNRIVEVFGLYYELEKIDDNVLLVANQSLTSFVTDYILFHNSVLYHIPPQTLSPDNDYIFFELSNHSWPFTIQVDLVPEDVGLIVAVLIFLSMVMVFFFIMVLILLGWHIKKQIEFRQIRVRRRRERVVMATRPASVSSLLADSVGPNASNYVMTRAIADQPMHNSKASLSTFLISMPNNPADPNRVPLYCGTAFVSTNKSRESKIFSNQAT